MALQSTLGCLVADGARARLILRHGHGDYETLSEFRPVEAAHTPRRDARSRVFAPSGASRAAVETPSHAAQVRERFAADLAEAVNQAVARERFQRLVVAAPPKMISAIEKALSPAARARLGGRLARDLTKLPELKLRERLEALSLSASPAHP